MPHADRTQKGAVCFFIPTHLTCVCFFCVHTALKCYAKIFSRRNYGRSTP
nr:MAG TPA: hypothetical protein [Caudoviricetes sp.]DAX51802.1 MAG TPA: hypothetical protein [Caudoviricetes sp.]